MADNGTRPQWVANLKSRDAAMRSPAVRSSAGSFQIRSKFDDPWFEAVASPPLLRASRRPVKSVPAAAQKNHCSPDDQAQRDSINFERRAARYREHASDQYHHHRPMAAAKERWPDSTNPRQKHMPDWCRSNSLFDPIQSTFKVVPAAANATRPSSAPPMRPEWDNSLKSKPKEQPSPQRSRGQVAAGQGAYNPLNHTWMAPPDATLDRVRTAASDRAHGFLGIASKPNVLLRNSFSPITGLFKDGSDMAQHAARQQQQQLWQQQQEQEQGQQEQGLQGAQEHLQPQEQAQDYCQQQPLMVAPHQQTQQLSGEATHPHDHHHHHHHHHHHQQQQQQQQQQHEQHEAERQQRMQYQRPSSAAGNARGNTPAAPVRPQSAGPQAYALPKRAQSAPRPVRAGASWGSYNPISHEWNVPPVNTRCSDPGRITERSEWTSGTHVRRSDVPRKQGSYDPIRGEWVVPPASRKVYEGLDYVPVGWFGKPEVVRPSTAVAGQAPWQRY